MEITKQAGPTADQAGSVKPQDWPHADACWIGVGGDGKTDGSLIGQLNPKKCVYFDFVREVDLPPELSRLTLRVSAFSHYQAYIDGAFLGRGPAMGQARLAFYDTWELDVQKHRGKRIRLAIRVFHEGAMTDTVQEFDYGHGGLIAALDSDQGTLLVTDESWSCRLSPELSVQAGMISRWGSFKEYWHGDRVDGWKLPGFDSSAWSPAVTWNSGDGEAGAVRLVSRETAPLTARPVAAQRLVAAAPQLGRILLDGESVAGFSGPVPEGPIELEPGESLAAPELTWDFGWVRTGHTELDLSGAAGIAEVYYGESLDTWRCDVVNFVADGTEWRSFHRRAFRFLKIRFIALEGRVRVRRVGICETVYPFHEDVTFDAEDGLANRVMEVSRRTLKGGSSYHYEDCPWREQALWVLDVRVMALMNTYLYGNHELTAKCLRQSLTLQREDGAVAATGPKENCFYFLDFMLHLAPMVREYYLTTGDRGLVDDLREPLLRLDRYMRTWIGSDGLLDLSLGAPGDEGKVFFDWNPKLVREGRTMILNALYVRHLEDMALIEELSGDAAAGPSLREQSRAVAAAAHELFYCAERGLYRDGEAGTEGAAYSMQANIAAVHGKVAPAEIERELLDRACFDGALQRPFGPSFYLLVFAAMNRVGAHASIASWIRDYWGSMLERGATTWWEVYDPTKPESAYPHPFLGQTPTYELDYVPVSLCHGWSGVPGYAIPRYLLGVDLFRIHRGEIGWQSDVPALYERVDYRVQTVGGPLHLRFERNGEAYDMSVVTSPYPVVRI